MTSSVEALNAFLSTKASALRRIASKTRGDLAFEDVKQEAWLVASDIGKRRGYDIDFADPQDAELVLAWLYKRHVQFAEKQSRNAVRIDKDWDDGESAGSALARLLTAPGHTDPVVQMVQLEEAEAYAVIARHSFSQAAAYVVLLTRFDWDAQALADDLLIALPSLRLRMRLAGIKVKFQPSFFDGISQVDPSFAPTPARRYASMRLAGCHESQRDWIAERQQSRPTRRAR